MTTDDFDMLDRLMELEGREFDRQNAARASALGDALARAGGNPELHKIVDGEVTFDKDGRATNADSLVAAAREAYLRLFPGQAVGDDFNARIRAAAGLGPRPAPRPSQPRRADGRFTGPGRVAAGPRESTPLSMNDLIRERAGR
jgi:hypothetical protein